MVQEVKVFFVTLNWALPTKKFYDTANFFNTQDS